MKKLPRVFRDDKGFVTAWVAERCPDMVGGFPNGVALGVISDNKLLAGVVYSDYYRKFGTMQLSIASDNPMWARREVITELLSYPFKQLNIFKCWITVCSDNEKCLKMVKHVGFKQEAVLSHQYGFKRHANILRMYQYEYKQLYLTENRHDLRLQNA